MNKRHIADKQKDIVSKVNNYNSKLLSFNFKYLTKNSKYNFDYFEKDIRKRHDAYDKLYTRLKELSANNFMFWKQAGKISGCEPIPYDRFNDPFKSVLSNVEIVSPDSQLAVFRFSNNDYRIIGKQGIKEDNVIYIIGFDFNFSAYDHG